MNIDNPKVSIIVPIYNVENYLKRCLESLVNQVYKNINIFLIDDCSTDNSSTIAKEYQKLYPSIITYYKREKNGGLAAARNSGIEISSGDYISFVDSDDWVDEKFVKELVVVAQKDHADIVICDYNYAWDHKVICQNSVEGISTNSSQKQKVALLRNHSVTRLYNRDFFMSCNIRFPEFLKRGEDMGVTIPMLTMTSKISIVNKPLYYYYQRSSSISNNNGKNVDLTFYKKAFNLVLQNSQDGFEDELEYRAIQEIMYGLNMVMIKSKKSNSEILANINDFQKQYPKWKENIYLKYCNKAKYIFIRLASKKQLFMLKLLMKIREKVS
ncbi:glycosyltransferase [[Clostridium] innocuum]|nr:glycosyltransferase [[Clostridium] innocuum]